jgi:hypothetical protein
MKTPVLKLEKNRCLKPNYQMVSTLVSSSSVVIPGRMSLAGTSLAFEVLLIVLILMVMKNQTNVTFKPVYYLSALSIFRLSFLLSQAVMNESIF